MTAQYAKNTKHQEAVESLMANLCVLTDAECMNIVQDIHRRVAAYNNPKYIVHGEDFMVKFSVLQSVTVSDAKVLNVTKDVTIEMKILDLVKENASITTTEMTRQLSVNRRTIQSVFDVLKGKHVIERKGGKRYGYWEAYE